MTAVASGRVRRLEFAPGGGLHFAPVADLTVDVDVEDATVTLSLDGMIVAEIALVWTTPEEGEEIGHRHSLVIEPYRSEAEWDAGPTVDIRETRRAEARRDWSRS